MALRHDLAKTLTSGTAHYSVTPCTDDRVYVSITPLQDLAFSFGDNLTPEAAGLLAAALTAAANRVRQGSLARYDRESPGTSGQLQQMVDEIGLMGQPMRWPMATLPLKREREECGSGFDLAYLARENGGASPEVWFAGREGAMQFESFAAIYEAGWRVD